MSRIEFENIKNEITAWCSHRIPSITPEQLEQFKTNVDENLAVFEAKVMNDSTPTSTLLTTFVGQNSPVRKFLWTMTSAITSSEDDAWNSEVNTFVQKFGTDLKEFLIQRKTGQKTMTEFKSGYMKAFWNDVDELYTRLNSRMNPEIDALMNEYKTLLNKYRKFIIQKKKQDAVIKKRIQEERQAQLLQEQQKKKKRDELTTQAAELITTVSRSESLRDETSRKVDGTVERMTSPKAKKQRIEFDYPDGFDDIIKRILPEADHYIIFLLKRTLVHGRFWEDESNLEILRSQNLTELEILMEYVFIEDPSSYDFLEYVRTKYKKMLERKGMYRPLQSAAGGSSSNFDPTTGTNESSQESTSRRGSVHLESQESHGSLGMTGLNVGDRSNTGSTVGIHEAANRPGGNTPPTPVYSEDDDDEVLLEKVSEAGLPASPEVLPIDPIGE